MLQVAWETVKSRTQIQLSCGKKRPKAVPSERATSSPACDGLRQKNAYLHLLGSQTETAWYAEQRVVCRPLQFGEPRLCRFCLISKFDWTFWLQRCTLLFGVLEILEYAMSSVAFCLLGKTCEKTICKQANHLNALCILHLCILNTSRKKQDKFNLHKISHPNFKPEPKKNCIINLQPTPPTHPICRKLER